MIHIAALRAFYDEYMYPRNGMPFDAYVEEYGYNIVTNYYIGFIHQQEANRQESMKIAAQAVTVDEMRQYYDDNNLLGLTGIEFEQFIHSIGYSQWLREKTYQRLNNGNVQIGRPSGTVDNDAFTRAAIAWGNHVDGTAVQKPVI